MLFRGMFLSILKPFDGMNEWSLDSEVAPDATPHEGESVSILWLEQPQLVRRALDVQIGVV